MDWIKIFDSQEEAFQRIKPGSPQLVVIGSIRISLVLYNGRFFAVQDACTHNGESLSKGKVNYLGDIICPWHGYRFNLETGSARDSSCKDLRTFPVKSDTTGFFIGV